MRRVFENSVKAAHSASIARACDGGVSELFRSCFFALAMFSRRWRENIASVPAGLLALWAKRTASRSAGADPPNCAPVGQSPPGVPAGLFSPFGLKAHGLQVRWRGPSELRPGRAKARPGFRPAYFRPLDSKRTASRSAGADPPNCAPCGRGPPGVPAGFQARAGWARVLVRRGC